MRNVLIVGSDSALEYGQNLVAAVVKEVRVVIGVRVGLARVGVTKLGLGTLIGSVLIAELLKEVIPPRVEDLLRPSARICQ